MSIYIGVDPGKSGAFAAIMDKGIETLPMPIAGKEIDIPRIADWLYEIAYGKEALVCIEKVHAMTKPESQGGRKQGVVSMFTFGKNVGILYGIVGTLSISLYEVSPPTWKKVVLEGTLKDKQAAIDFCMRVYPTVSLLRTERSKKPHDGIADALCIAHYATRKYKLSSGGVDAI